jgi:hypothetical protein
VDLELIAALIDGRLADEDRARAMKLLANSDEALEIFAQATREQEQPNEPKVVPISGSRRWRQWKLLVPVAAAAGLTLLMVPRMRNRDATVVSGREYAMELSRDPHFANGLTGDWEQRAWSVTRGQSFREAAGVAQAGNHLDSTTAFRLGARSVDLQVALSRGDTAVAARVTDEILDVLKAVPYSEPVADVYISVKSHLATNTPPQSAVRAADAEHAMRRIVLAEPFVFGQWVAAAELAARIHDASFFESAPARRFTRSAMAKDLTAEETEALRRIDAQIQHGLPEQAFNEIHENLQTIVRHRGG